MICYFYKQGWIGLHNINLILLCGVIDKIIKITVIFHRFIKSQYAGKRGSHSIKSQMDNKHSDKSEARSCAMSDTSEAPSLGNYKTYYY